MKRGFSLLELVVVLAVLSLLLTVFFPPLYRRSLNDEELFKNRFTSLLQSSFSFTGSPEFCVNFKERLFTVNSQEIELPYPPESLALPGLLVSSKAHSTYCFQPSPAGYYLLNLKRGEGQYLSVLFLYPTGEALFLNLKESEKETLKDKVEKGRITRWFSYYSF